ncbi:MAG: DUF1416 domain-containing protein [Actinomycetota bacterium]
MATIDGVVFQGIDTCPFASVRLLTPSGHAVAEQTANAVGEFRFVVPSGAWGIEAAAGDQRIAIRDVIAMDGETLPVYVCIDSGDRTVFPRRNATRRRIDRRPQRRVIDLTEAREAAGRS